MDSDQLTDHDNLTSRLPVATQTILNHHFLRDIFVFLQKGGFNAEKTIFQTSSSLVLLIFAVMLLIAPGTVKASVHRLQNGAAVNPASNGNIIVDASPIMYPIFQMAKYQYNTGGQIIDPVTSTSSLHGILSLLYDAPYSHVDVAMSAIPCEWFTLNPISNKNCGILTDARIGLGAVEVVMNPAKSCVGSLSKAQLQGIWQGTITNWQQLNSSCPNQAIVPRAEDLSTDTRILFNRMTGIDGTAEEQTIYASGWPRLATDRDMEQAINDHADQIGYTANSHPLDPAPPQASTSRYMDSVDSNVLTNLGQNRGGCGSSHIQPTGDDLLILDFGQPMINDQVYLYDYKTYANIFPDVENGIIGFINGYVSCPATNNTHLWLGVGLNNQSTKDKNNINFEHGQKWGQMVAALNTLINNAGLQNKIGIAGAMDIEPSWSSFNVTQDWLNGFVQGSNYSLFFDFGTCTDAGCQQNNVPDKYGWTTDNIYTVSSGGIRNRYPLPEIYNTMWAQALYWQNLNKYEMSQNHSPIRFAGVMTQQMACIEKDTGIIKGKNGEPDACDPTIKNSPAEGWQQLQQVLFSDPQTKDYASNWYLTDISYRR